MPRATAKDDLEEDIDFQYSLADTLDAGADNYAEKLAAIQDKKAELEAFRDTADEEAIESYVSPWLRDHRAS